MNVIKGRIGTWYQKKSVFFVLRKLFISAIYSTYTTKLLTLRSKLQKYTIYMLSIKHLRRVTTSVRPRSRNVVTPLFSTATNLRLPSSQICRFSMNPDEGGASDAQLQHLKLTPIFLTVGCLFLGTAFFRAMLFDPELPPEKPVTWTKLQLQDAETSNAVIDALRADPTFANFARLETLAITQRDEEDAQKLQVGIELDINKGVIPAHVDVEPIKVIQVEGKSPDQVAQDITSSLGSAAEHGCVLTLQGLSGTGKGTTVAILKKTLPNAVTWSNGNVFRSLTLLACKYAELNNCSFQEALTPENLLSFRNMLSFGKFNGQFDIAIEGLGYSTRVSEVQNTLLKSAQIGKNIPTVAAVTQGEVITFVQECLDAMVAANHTVLLEGREQTLNYIRTPHRFELSFHDINVIGQRRAAQVIGAETYLSIKKEMDSSTAVQHPPNHQVTRHLKGALNRLYQQKHQNKVQE